MAQEKLISINTALAQDDSPVTEIGRHGIFTVGRAIPKLQGGTVGKEIITIYTTPKQPTPPEASQLNAVLEKLIDSIGLIPDDIEAFAGGFTQLGGKNFYHELTLGGLVFAEQHPGRLKLNPTIEGSKNNQELNERLSKLTFEPREGALRFQTGVYVHLLPNERLARLLLLRDQGHQLSQLPKKAHEKLIAYEVGKMSRGEDPYPHIKLPNQPNPSSSL